MYGSAIAWLRDLFGHGPGMFDALLGVYGFLALAALVLVIRHGRRSSSLLSRWMPPLTVLLVAAAGLAASDARYSATSRRMRADLIVEAEGLARAMDPDLVAALRFSSADATNPAHQRISGHLRDFSRARGHRSIYTLARTGRGLVTGPRGPAPEPATAPPPGSPFTGLPPSGWMAVTGGVPAMVEPGAYGDGSVVTVLAPVRDPGHGLTDIAVGIEVAARDWHARLTGAASLPLFCALAVLSLLLAGQRVLQDVSPGRGHGVHRHADAIVAAAMGLLLTAILVWTAHDIESRARRMAFVQLAESHARRIARTFDDVSNFGMAALANFFESSEVVTAPEFQSFARSLPMHGAVQSYEWVPRVGGSRRDALAAEAARSGVAGFALWEPGPADTRQPAAARPVHHPRLYAVSPAGEPPPQPGLDRSADPAFLVAADTAIRTGLTTATLPADKRYRGSPHSLILLRPVRSASPGAATAPDKSCAGFILAQVTPRNILPPLPDAAGHAGRFVAIDLADLPALSSSACAGDAPGDKAGLLYAASSRPGPTPPAAIFPLFLCGRTLAVRVCATPEFLTANPLRDGLGIAVSGCLLTALMSLFVGVLAGRERLLGEEVRRRTQDLRESERRLVRAQRVARMGSWHQVAGSDEPEWSPEIRRLFDVKPTEPSTREVFLSRIHPDDRERVARAWQGAAAGGSHEIEYRALVDGATRWMSERTERDGDGQAPCVGIVQDITERRRLQDQLFQAQRLDTVGRLAGGIAHDFNNLLQVISGFCDLLRERFRPDGESSADLAEIANATQKATDLTRQLLAFSRRQVMSPRVLDLNAVIEQSRRMLVRVLGEDIRIDLQPGQGLDRVRIDPGQFDQVFMNLAVNARDAMTGGGVLTIRTGNLDLSDHDARSIPDAAPGRYVRVTIADTGCGMTPEIRRQIFEPFFTTKGRQGTGLGLSVVYGIVRQQEGFIQVESEPGRGAAFHVCFPACSVARDPEAVPESPEDLDAYRGQGESLLVVEDEPGVLRFLLRILGSAGYSVHGVETHAGAIATAADMGSRLDVLVSDVVLPDGTGLDLADQLLARVPGLHVLLVSGHTEEHSRVEDTLRRGIRFLQKPLSARDILRALHEMLHP
jgi:signal transduction histidine kinase/CHASE1-domain containing sensor protein